MRKIVRVIFLFFVCINFISFSKIAEAEESNRNSTQSESMESSVVPAPTANRAVVNATLTPDKALINDGDEITWTLEVLAPTNPQFNDFKLEKNLPANVSYVSESTIFNGMSVPDSIVWGNGASAQLGDATITFKTIIAGAPGETISISVVGLDASTSIFSAEASVTLNGGSSTSDTSSSSSESTSNSESFTTETTTSTETISTLESNTSTTVAEVANDTTDTGTTNRKTLPKTGASENIYLFMLGICLSFIGVFALFKNYKKINFF